MMISSLYCRSAMYVSHTFLMLKLNPCVPIPPLDIFQAYTSSDVPRVGHFLFAGCPRVRDFSDSSITLTKHMILAMKNCILPQQNVRANTHTHAIYYIKKRYFMYSRLISLSICILRARVGH